MHRQPHRPRPLDGPARREAIALDPQGKAVSDPHGLALSPRRSSGCTAPRPGTHELLVYELPGLPFQDYGGPGDHIDPTLLADSERFYRIPLGGRPMADSRSARTASTSYVANYLLNAIQVVDPASTEGRRTIRSAARPSRRWLGRARRSSTTASSRSTNGTVATVATTKATRTPSRWTRKTTAGSATTRSVLSLRQRHAHRARGPGTAGRRNLSQAMRKKSLIDSMLGPEPTDADVKALVAFLDTLESPPNPNRGADGELTEAAKRGEVVFKSREGRTALAATRGPYYTDGKIHDVGTGESGDVYKGYNPPSLIGVYDRQCFCTMAGRNRWKTCSRARTARISSIAAGR